MYTPAPKGFRYPKGLTDEKAARMLMGFRNGETFRKLFVKRERFDAYCKAHPEYAREALPLLEANAGAAQLRKGETLRTTTHRKQGVGQYGMRSLDAPVFADSSLSLGDTISRGLWD